MSQRLIDATTLRAEFTGGLLELWHYTGIWAVIDAAPTIETKQEWIGVKDRLPEDDLPEGSKKMRIKVLVAIRNNKGVYTVRTQTRALGGSYHVSEEWEWGKHFYGDVTHWMPLPEPPEKE